MGVIDQICLAQDRDKWRAPTVPTILYTSIHATHYRTTGLPVLEYYVEVINLQVPYNDGNLLSGYMTGGLSSSAQLHVVNYLVRG
jgi:hypothetical protein